MRTAVVVGGGMSGLAAARRFATSATGRVVLFESDPRVGGKVATARLRSGPVDVGPDQFLRRDPSLEEWCRSLGLGDAIVVPAAATAGVWSYGRARELPAGLVLGVPGDLSSVEASGIVSAEGCRVASERRRAALLPIGEPELGLRVGSAGAEEERSAGSLLRERLGDEVVDRLVDPLLGGINAGSVDHLSLATVAPQVARAIAGRSDVVAAVSEVPRAESGVSPFFGLAGGAGRLAEEADRELRSLGVEVITSASVGSIGASGRGDGLVVVTTAGERLSADHVVLATPAAVSGQLLAEMLPGASRILSGIPSSSVTVTTFVLPEGSLRAPDGWTGILVPRVEGRVTTAVSFLSRKWQWVSEQRLDGRRVETIRVSAGRFGDDRAWAMSDSQLVTELRGELRDLLSVEADPLEVDVRRWPSAFPQYMPGHGARMSALADALGHVPALALAGSLLGGIGVPACIKSGTEAAARLTERVRATG